MRLPRNGNAVAIALAGLAVVLAATGTAVAVSTPTTTIADPLIPAQKARVDASGRLATSGVLSTLSGAGTLQTQYQFNQLTAPTTAKIAITKISLTNPKANAGNTTSETEVFLRKVNVGTDGTSCTGASQNLAIYTLEPGDDIQDPFPSPLIVGPTGTTKYCIGLYVIPTNSNGNVVYFQYYSWTGYVAAGTYTPPSGATVATSAGKRPASRQR